VYTENHTKPVSTNCAVTDCESRWKAYIQFRLDFKELILKVRLRLSLDNNFQI
jgi:hypothetical protein